MSVYLIIDLDIFDADRFAGYQAGFPPLAARHGGRYLVRGAEVTMNGDWGGPIHRMVMLEFPDRAAMAATFGDPDYPALAAIREASARSRSLVVDGVDGADGVDAGHGTVR